MTTAPVSRTAGEKPSDRPAKRSIAVLIEEPRVPPAATGESRWLLVRRPPDDEDLPDAWGLPAGSFRAGESEEALVRRIGREKLGVELRPARALLSGHALRPRCRLEMTLWAAQIERGTPEVPQPAAGVTRYRDWGWRTPNALRPAAERGSLCCRLGLAWAGNPPDGGGNDS